MVALALDGLLVVAVAFLTGLAAIRGASWGPNGAVGAWLVVIPPLVLLGAVLGVLITAGRFDWVPGGRPASSGLLAGFLAALAVGSYYLIDNDAPWSKLAAVTPFVMAAGCFVAVHSGPFPGRGAKTAITAILGTAAVAGWILIASGIVMYYNSQVQQAEMAVQRQRDLQASLAAEFRALGHNAPLWRYLGFMYFDDDAVRTESRAIIASRPDLNERLIEYLDNEILANDAVNYIFDVHESPSATLAPVYARLLQKKLAAFREHLDGRDMPEDRDKFEMSRFLGAAIRIQQAGGDLTLQLTAWRDYLRQLNGMRALEGNIDSILRKQGRQ
jgi:hypothetical protein